MLRLTRSIMRNLAATAWRVLSLVLGLAVPFAAAVAAEPHNWQLGMQPPATPVQERIVRFHDELLIIIFLITVFVLGLLLYVIVRFNARRHPVPTRTSHNSVIEILWTVVPVIILVAIAIPSFKLMYYMDRVPNAEMTIKVTGEQWYWSYEYPDQGFSFKSNLIGDNELKPGQKRLLDVDNPLVVPVDTRIRVQVTSAPTGVIHSWFIPSFGVQEYAMPGRLNEAWFLVEREGAYYGECNQICGVNHAFMPIKVVAVSKADFQKWLGEAKQKFAATPPATDSTTLLAAARPAAEHRSAGN
jgi:cytochrome c oxidase subunit II